MQVRLGATRLEAADADRARRYAVVTEERRADAEHPLVVLLVVERVAARAHDTQLPLERPDRGDRLGRASGEADAADDRVDLGFGQRGEDRLADAGAVRQLALAEVGRQLHRAGTVN